MYANLKVTVGDQELAASSVSIRANVITVELDAARDGHNYAVPGGTLELMRQDSPTITIRADF